ncbi:MAG: RNA-guided pseudouridylation complex pseudouridine synthase subunit Cbf5 [Candidatus Altiarchaeota archaeon]|nr:RNA-guided pseudouridylation complex pseudouridine synthase subunit Cbf5 [Candidatus Altiarchaeota archaeon]
MLLRDIEEINDKYGVDPWNRPIRELLEYGLVVIDKPAGPTSHQVTSWVRNMLNARKAGHSGTLDPRVTGVLPITFNSATKIVQALLVSPKAYVTVMHLHDDTEEHKIRNTMAEFEGEIMQLPPVKSAVKRQNRMRTVYSIDVLEINGRDVLFSTIVQAGTYIRKLCHDIGTALGTGAHMTELRRTRAGPFTESSLTRMDDLREAWELFKKGDETELRRLVRPVEDGVASIPKIYVKNAAVSSLAHGASLGVNGVSMVEESAQAGKLVAMLTVRGELVGLATAKMEAEDMVKAIDGEAAKTEKIVIKRDAYPKTWK